MKKLEVRLRREPGEERIVGQLAETGPRPVGSAGGQIVFEYDPAFLRDPLCRRESRTATPNRFSTRWPRPRPGGVSMPARRG
jgi:hypothetical protein